MSNSSLYQSNIEVLTETDPDLARQVTHATLDGRHQLIRSRNGQPNVLLTSGSDRIAFYDNEDPDAYVRQYLAGMRIQYAPFVVFMGLGLGAHLDHFVSSIRKHLSTEKIVIFERDVVLFRLALEVRDFRGLLTDPDIHFFVGRDPEDSYVALRNTVFRREFSKLRSLKIIPLPASVKVHHAYYLRAADTVKKCLCQIMNAVGNDCLDALVAEENMFLNIKHTLANPGVNSLYGKYRGKPAVLAAAGPSLSKNIHLLEGLRERALVMSCDSTFIPLMKNGTPPHLVTSMERTPGTDLYFDGVEDFSGVYFVSTPVLMPETIGAFKGRQFIAYRKYAHFDWLEVDKGSIVAGLSVANFAFNILVKLGCDPIILIGQDLAYGEGGDTHVNAYRFGTFDDTIGSLPVIELEGTDGSPVRSERTWEIMKLYYEADIAGYGGTCINATEGGARIRGAEVMTFEEAVEKHCRETFHPQAVLDETYVRFSGDVDVRKELKRIRAKTIDTRRRVEQTIVGFKGAVCEARSVEREIIQPFLAGDTDASPLSPRLLSVEKRRQDLNAAIMGDRQLYEIMAMTIQAQSIALDNELAFLKDIYSNRGILAMARHRAIREWLAVVGSLLLFTRDILDKAEDMLAAEVTGGYEPIRMVGEVQ